MRKLLLVFLLANTVIAVGQNEKRKMKFDTDFNPEQQAILKTKKMALALDLNDSQQSQILTLNKKWIQEKMTLREAHKSLNKEEMTADQKFEMMNKALDTKIAHQAEVKKILNKEQYETWKESSRKMNYRSKNKGSQGHRKGQKSEKGEKK